MRVTIVGGGIAGLSTAWSLVKRGHAVTLLERGPLPNPLAASGDHHRIIRRAYGQATGYGRADLRGLRGLGRDVGRPWRKPSRSARLPLRLARRRATRPSSIARASRRAASRYRPVRRRTRPSQRWPFLEAGTFRYAYLLARRAARCIAARSPRGSLPGCATNGANVYEEQQGRRRSTPTRAASTLATGEVMQADRVVVAAGAWVLKLFPDLGGELKTYRTALAYVEPPADLEGGLGGGAGDSRCRRQDRRLYRSRPSGGAGMKFGSGLHKVATSDADWNREPVAGKGEAIRDLFSPPLARIEEYAVSEVVTCAYTFTADERFFALEEGRMPGRLRLLGPWLQVRRRGRAACRGRRRERRPGHADIVAAGGTKACGVTIRTA